MGRGAMRGDVVERVKKDYGAEPELCYIVLQWISEMLMHSFFPRYENQVNDRLATYNHKETCVDRNVHRKGPLEVSDSATYANSTLVRELLACLRNISLARKRCNLTTLEGDADACKVKVDDECYSIHNLLIDSHRGRFKPSHSTGTNVLVNTQNYSVNRKERTLLGHRTVHRNLPLGKTIYALGRVTLDKDTGELILRRTRSWTEPFMFRYGTPEDALREMQEQKSCTDTSSVVFFGMGTLTRGPRAFEIRQNSCTDTTSVVFFRMGALAGVLIELLGFATA
mmetsp:Transcript_4523/g.9082  ORF Transcript_4523/g.9082 Transcript_4523/m.9082 type:complete len:283 (-) Transcript_4523:218-1066(-)